MVKTSTKQCSFDMNAYDQLWDEAEENFGLVTTSVAKGLGISEQCLTALEQRGMLMRMGHGVYQVKHHLPDSLDVYARGVAIVGSTAYLRSASVIAMLNLVPTSPSLLYVGAVRRVRRRLPEGIRLRDRHATRTEVISGIRCQCVVDALREAKAEGSIEADRVVIAAKNACEKGYISHEECAEFQSQS